MGKRKRKKNQIQIRIDIKPDSKHTSKKVYFNTEENSFYKTLARQQIEIIKLRQQGTSTEVQKQIEELENLKNILQIHRAVENIEYNKGSIERKQEEAKKINDKMVEEILTKKRQEEIDAQTTLQNTMEEKNSILEELAEIQNELAEIQNELNELKEGGEDSQETEKALEAEKKALVEAKEEAALKSIREEIEKARRDNRGAIEKLNLADLEKTEAESSELENQIKSCLKEIKKLEAGKESLQELQKKYNEAKKQYREGLKTELEREADEDENEERVKKAKE